MPFFRNGSDLLYFAHVPKCAGTSVENYLHGRFGTLAFLDRGFPSQPPQRRWNKSSPQHLCWRHLDRLVPPSFFAARFAVVRHPVSRLISVFHHHRDAGDIASDLRFSNWLCTLPQLMRQRPFTFDNHLRPMHEIVPEDAQVFRLEAGLEPLVAWLDQVTGSETGPRKIGSTNCRDGRAGTTKRMEVQPNAADLALIHQLYGEDFERFGYAAHGTPGDDNYRASC